MIQIEESITSKVPGVTSLKVTFPYNELLVQAIKTIPNAVYSKKTKTWEVPLSSTTELIDSLTQFDDINLTLMKDVVPEPPVVYQLHEYKSKPYPHQIEGIQYGLNHDNFLLLDQPGLGKSLQSIYIAMERYYLGQVSHCLVICGVNALKYNWKAEIEKHTNLSCRILGQRINKKGNLVVESVSKRLEQLKSPINEFFVIINIETLRNDDIVKELISQKTNKFEMCIFDEAHHSKDPTSQQGSNLLKLTNFKYKIAMTGTLLLNSPLDSYVPLKWIGAERSTYSNFKYYFCKFSGPFNNILLGYKNLKLLKDQIEQNSIRRTKSILRGILPEKVIINELIEMNDAQAEFYNNIKEGILDEVDKIENPDISCLLALIGRLRQATALPSILSTSAIPSSKVERCIDLIHEVCSDENNKVVVFSVYKKTATEIAEHLQEFHPLLCTGDVDDFTIDQNIKEFQTNDYNKVMVCTTAKMGTGVTLNRATTVIFIDTPYTQAEYEQCQDRCHRIGSKGDSVTIYNLICVGTFDERVAEIVARKDALSNYMNNNTLSPMAYEILKNLIKDL